MIQPDKEKKKLIDQDTLFLANWYSNRPENLQPSTDYNLSPEIGIDPSLPYAGQFNPKDKSVTLSNNFENSYNIPGHEINHYFQDQLNSLDYRRLVSDPITKYTETAEMDKLRKEQYDLGNGQYYDYLLSPDEVHSRLMQFRMRNKFEPDEIIDKERLKTAIDKEGLKLEMFNDDQMIDMLNSVVSADEVGEIQQMAAYGGTIKTSTMKKIKYAFGTSKTNPVNIQSPDQALVENDIMWAKTQEKVNSDFFIKALDAVGGFALNTGLSMMGGSSASGAMSGSAGSLTNSLVADNSAADAQKVPKAAYGGSAIEVEGDEVAQYPTGDLIQFNGPRHENGGIDINLPNGTDIYSDRISIDNKTMAQRKLEREKNAAKFTKMYDKDKSADVKSTLDRILEINAQQEAFDLEIQGTANRLTPQNGLVPKAALGTSPGPTQRNYSSFFSDILAGMQTEDPSGVATPVTANTSTASSSLEGATEDPSFLSSLYGQALSGLTNYFQSAGSPTGGDIVGTIGNLMQANNPRKLTLENRAGDQPNVNAFKNYGKNGLAKLDQAKGALQGNLDSALLDIDKSAQIATRTNSGGARSINTARALNLATQSVAQDAKSKANVEYANMLTQMLTGEAGMLNDIDTKVMTGEHNANEADRMDRDAFFTQLAKDEVARGQAVSGVGKNMNALKEREYNQNLLDSMFDYSKVNLKSGKVSANTKALDGYEVGSKSQGEMTGSIKAIQKQMGLPETGIMTPEILQALLQASSGANVTVKK